MKMTIAYVYCSHCLHYSKAAIEANFFCGKLVNEVNVKGNPDSVVKKKSKFPRFKRTKKNSMKIKGEFLLGSDEKKD
ncbi:Acetyl-CoA acetyltransferase, mitochondrial [Gossypium arboreum]|uniref:Acetyl-CoA acetyltransferase, mitochondrial n=1 Tax=Gossypium arboreum TaxID=29729 RepID=A0A0B0NQ51_GOSAR|nr:Acetyl-CoA acetyltransferase, mitochondrial [Gossypium arboreum]